jgi:hypothetical protein
MLWTLRGDRTRQVGPISLVDRNLDDADDEPFFATVQEALGLLERVDPRRLRRVQAQLRFIVNTELTALGQYDAAIEACRLDFNRLRVFRERLGQEWLVAEVATVLRLGQEWLVAEVATVLVHEATHGYLLQKGFTYGRDYRRRAEQLCVREEERFVERIDRRLRDVHPLVTPFDERRWYPYWNSSRWTQFRALLVRLREAYRDSAAREGKPWVEDKQ